VADRAALMEAAPVAHPTVAQVAPAQAVPVAEVPAQVEAQADEAHQARSSHPCCKMHSI